MGPRKRFHRHRQERDRWYHRASSSAPGCVRIQKFATVGSASCDHGTLWCSYFCSLLDILYTERVGNTGLVTSDLQPYSRVFGSAPLCLPVALRGCWEMVDCLAKAPQRLYASEVNILADARTQKALLFFFSCGSSFTFH